MIGYNEIMQFCSHNYFDFITPINNLNSNNFDAMKSKEAENKEVSTNNWFTAHYQLLAGK